MVLFCSVYGCGNRGGRDRVSFFRIPKVITHQGEETRRLSEERRQAWIRRIRRADLKEECSNYRVCSLHFIGGKPSTLYDRLNPDWEPSQCMGYGHQTPRLTNAAVQRYERTAKKRKKQVNAQEPVLDTAAASTPTTAAPEMGTPAVCDFTLQPSSGQNEELGLGMDMIVNSSSIVGEQVRHLDMCPDNNLPVMNLDMCVEGDLDSTPHQRCSTTVLECNISNISLKSSLTQTEEQVSHSTDIQTGLQLQDMLAADKELVRCNEKIYSLSRKLSNYVMTEETFQDDEKVKFYTGLPKLHILMAVFGIVKDFLFVSACTALDPFQQLILTLMKLRLNLPQKDLAYRFLISQPTVSRIFERCVTVLYHRLKFLINWPERHVLRQTMPLSFRKHFGTNVAVIIDCFEIFIERPANLKARRQVWSHYKHHSTVKFLLGITPQGTVSYISQGWGGLSSDKWITENSDLLGNLLPGDVVLADRGFTVEEAVGFQCAELKMPAFTKGKKQLSAYDIERTRKIANVRIHVERVIGMVRQKYTFLSSTLPCDVLVVRDEGGLPLIDKIVFVACALTNLSKSVIPFD